LWGFALAPGSLRQSTGNVLGETPKTGGRPADGAVQKNERYRLARDWSRVRGLSLRQFLIFARLPAFPNVPAIPCGGTTTRISSRPQLSTRQELSDFLASVEKRAFKQAVYAVRDDEAALDIVQDSMMKLAESYSERPATEFPMLFQRILQNNIRDWYRRQKVRNTWTSVFSSFGSKDEDDDFDILESIKAENTGSIPVSPADQLEQSQVLAAIEEAIQRLPGRQREAFMLRYWEELDVAETAAAMGCSEGSVKTHCSRAVDSLSKLLKAKGISMDSVIGAGHAGE
jgi:RNA polymerase sigma-70 factor (ECF subfamily)